MNTLTPVPAHQAMPLALALGYMPDRFGPGGIYSLPPAPEAFQTDGTRIYAREVLHDDNGREVCNSNGDNVWHTVTHSIPEGWTLSLEGAHD